MLSKINKKLGFGAMRLPINNGKIDKKQICDMFDFFLENGFNYFDTASGYLNGLSEEAIRVCLSSRYERNKFLLANKLTDSFFKSEDDLEPLFERQLKACGVEYFDFYLMHAQNLAFYNKYNRCKAYEFALEKKKQGKIKHIGISFHDEANVLEKILAEKPFIEFVQLQVNYVDMDDKAIQAKACVEVCNKFNKPIIVMEPVKGGILANLSNEAKKVFERVGEMRPSSFAIRYASGVEGVVLVLSGMSDLAQVKDNVSFMKDFAPLNFEEQKAVEEVKKIILGEDFINCTAWRYCVKGCPMTIPIPDVFADLNLKKRFNEWNSDWYYMVHTQNKGRASDCISCKKCESVCPQHLKITSLLKEVALAFDKKQNND